MEQESDTNDLEREKAIKFIEEFSELEEHDGYNLLFRKGDMSISRSVSMNWETKLCISEQLQLSKKYKPRSQEIDRTIAAVSNYAILYFYAEKDLTTRRKLLKFTIRGLEEYSRHLAETHTVGRTVQRRIEAVIKGLQNRYEAIDVYHKSSTPSTNDLKLKWAANVTLEQHEKLASRFYQRGFINTKDKEKLVQYFGGKLPNKPIVLKKIRVNVLGTLFYSLTHEKLILTNQKFTALSLNRYFVINTKNGVIQPSISSLNALLAKKEKTKQPRVKPGNEHYIKVKDIFNL